MAIAPPIQHYYLLSTIEAGAAPYGATYRSTQGLQQGARLVRTEPERRFLMGCVKLCNH